MKTTQRGFALWIGIIVIAVIIVVITLYSTSKNSINPALIKINDEQVPKDAIFIDQNKISSAKDIGAEAIRVSDYPTLKANLYITEAIKNRTDDVKIIAHKQQGGDLYYMTLPDMSLPTEILVFNKEFSYYKQINLADLGSSFDDKIIWTGNGLFLNGYDKSTSQYTYWFIDVDASNPALQRITIPSVDSLIGAYYGSPYEKGVLIVPHCEDWKFSLLPMHGTTSCKKYAIYYNNVFTGKNIKLIETSEAYTLGFDKDNIYMAVGEDTYKFPVGSN